MQPRRTKLRSTVASLKLIDSRGWIFTTALCLIPVFLWIRLYPLTSFDSFSTIIGALGKIAGIAGMVLYALNFLYATRARFLEQLFGGLNRVYMAHHILGGLALILLLLHPLFMVLQYADTSIETGLLLLVPDKLNTLSAIFDSGSKQHAVVLQELAISFGSFALMGTVILLLVTFYFKLPYRVWLFTHKFLGGAFFFAGLHVFLIRSDTSIDMPLRLYMLTVAAVGLGSYLYRTLMGNILIRRYQYGVVRVDKVHDAAVRVTMKPTGLALRYKPGQFVFVRFEFGGNTALSKEWHPFSITSHPNDRVLQVTVKGLGDFTNELQRLRVGSPVTVEGAFGKFSFTNFKGRQQVWIAGGIGITPFLSMAKELTSIDTEVDLFYSVRTKSELIDWKSLQSQATTNKRMRIHTHVFEKEKTYLTADYITKVSGSFKDKDILICGPPAMMQLLRAQLREMGVPNNRIHTEEFSVI